MQSLLKQTYFGVFNNLFLPNLNVNRLSFYPNIMFTMRPMTRTSTIFLQSTLPLFITVVECVEQCWKLLKEDKITFAQKTNKNEQGVC